MLVGLVHSFKKFNLKKLKKKKNDIGEKEWEKYFRSQGHC